MQAQEGEDQEALKGVLGAEACASTYDRVYATTNSVDAATKAKAACEARVKESGRFEFPSASTGTLWVDAEGQIDSDWSAAYDALDRLSAEAGKGAGEGLGLVVPHSMSPTFTAKLPIDPLASTPPTPGLAKAAPSQAEKRRIGIRGTTAW